jgi:segregation and condensation protein A
MIEDDIPPAVEAWTAPGPDDAATAADAFVIDIEGFEGPLDLLLALARTQKVDIARISILALVEQYLSYIDEVQRIKLEIAADYLVMAAWLAYLKSRLLLPREKTDDPTMSGEELAQRLAFRLMRLDAMRTAAAQLLTRRRLGRDVFARGAPEGVKTIRETEYTAQIYDLLQAYAVQRTRTIKQVHVVKARTVWSIRDARRHLERLIGGSAGDWVQLDLFLERYMPAGASGGEMEKTVVASSFGASLELAREGVLEIKQDAPFAPIYMRKRGTDSPWEKIGG